MDMVCYNNDDLGKDIGALIGNVGSGVAAATVGAAGGGGAAGTTEAPKEEEKEEKKEESEEESDDDMGFGKNIYQLLPCINVICNPAGLFD